MQKLNVRGTARTERFHGEGVAAELAEVIKEQAGEQSFTNAGVGAGDEDNSRPHVPGVLTTDYTDGTDKNWHD